MNDLTMLMLGLSGGNGGGGASRCTINFKNPQDEDSKFFAFRTPIDQTSSLIFMPYAHTQGRPIEYDRGRYLVATSGTTLRGYLPCTYTYRVDGGSESDYKNGMLKMGYDIYLIPNEPLPENVYIWIDACGIVEQG